MVAKKNRIFMLMGVLVLFFSLEKISIGATLTDISIVGSNSSNDGWVVTNYYIKEMVVLRSYNGEPFNIRVQDGNLLAAWREVAENKGNKTFEYTVGVVDQPGIDVSYGSLTVDYNNSDYHNPDLNVSGNKIILDLESKQNHNTDKKPTVNGPKNINVSSSVPNGRYRIDSTVKIGSKGYTETGTLIIKTAVNLQVDDIDFGTHPSNSKIQIKETSNISITNGVAGEKYSLWLKSDSGSGTGDNFIMNLSNPNNNEKIPVKLSIEGGGQNLAFGSTGNDNRTLEAVVDAVTPSKGGTYSGSATIVFQYD